MGGQPTKLANPRANVINNVEVIDHTPHLDSLYNLILNIGSANRIKSVT